MDTGNSRGINTASPGASTHGVPPQPLAQISQADNSTPWIVPQPTAPIPHDDSGGATGEILRSARTDSIGPPANPTPPAHTTQSADALAEALRQVMMFEGVFDSPPSEWSALAFTGEDKNPNKPLIAHAHMALNALAPALGLSMAAPLDMNAPDLSPGEKQTLNAFVRSIPQLPPAARAERDLQLHGIALARSLFRFFKETLTNQDKNNVARAAIVVPSAMGAWKHSHGFGTVLLSAYGRSSAKYVSTTMRATISSIGFLGTYPARAAETVVRAVQSGFKEDKTSNKALKLLCEVLTSIDHGAVADDVLDAGAAVLGAVVQGKRSNRLQEVLKEKATPAQMARHEALFGTAS